MQLHDRELLGDTESLDQLNHAPHQSETEDKPKSPDKMEDFSHVPKSASVEQYNVSSV